MNQPNNYYTLAENDTKTDFGVGPHLSRPDRFQILGQLNNLSNAILKEDHLAEW